MSWLPIIATVIGCFVLKAIGTFVPERVLERDRVAATTALVPVALIAAVTALQTVTIAQRYSIDARLAGVAVAAVAVAVRAPFLVVVVAASATAAIIRAI